MRFWSPVGAGPSNSRMIVMLVGLPSRRIGSWAGCTRAAKGTSLQGYGLHSWPFTQGDAVWDEDVPGPLCPGLC